MQRGKQALLLSALSLCVLSACKVGDVSGSGTTGNVGGSSDGSSVMPGTGSGGTPGLGSAPPPPGPGNTVIATPSVSGTVSVAVGARQSISVSFNSSDGLPVTGFALTGTTLPAGWTGPEVFTCTAVGTGNDCVLNLTYAPDSVASGSVTLNYLYVDHAGVRRTPGGSLTIPYAAITSNNVGATIAPAGQIKARINAGDQTVSVNFTTDDGNVATNLAVTTDLASLPPNWSSAASSFGCDIVMTGSGCQLLLDFKPTQSTRGTLTLNYQFVDNSGTARTAALNIPYSTSVDSSVEATVSPAGQINAVRGGSGQPVAVTFTTDDGNPATNLVVSSGLSALPAGWSSESNAFRCSTLGAGNGCQLRLRYAPTDLSAGAFRVDYVYTDAGGTFRTGSLNINYAATTDNNVAATPTPSGQINAVVGAGTSNASVTFSTDDGRPASALSLVTDVTTLPSGWSGAPGNFACSEVIAGAGCQLNLVYAPTSADAGTLSLKYSYINNAGVPKTGSVNLPYRAMTDDTVNGTPSPPALVVTTGMSADVDVIFTTDDGNPASDLAIVSGLSPLPADWSSAVSSFGCATLTTGPACKLTLTYRPVAAAAATLTLSYVYTNNAGIAKTGSTTITYSATP